MLVLDKQTAAKYRRHEQANPVEQEAQPPVEIPVDEPVTVVEEIPQAPVPALEISVAAAVDAQAAVIAKDILKQVAASSKMESATQLMAASQKRLADAVTLIAEHAVKPKEWDFDIERGLNNQITKVKARQSEIG